MKYCSNCGAEVTGRFCSKCGKEYEELHIESQNSENVLHSLYSIRAGLSQISVLYDEAEECKLCIEEIETTEAQLAEAKKEQTKSWQDNDEVNLELQKISDLEKEIEKYQEKGRKKKGLYVFYKIVRVIAFLLRWIFTIIAVLAGFFGIISCAPLVFNIIPLLLGGSSMDMGVGLIGAGVLLGGAIVLGILAFLMYKLYDKMDFLDELELRLANVTQGEIDKIQKDVVLAKNDVIEKNNAVSNLEQTLKLLKSDVCNYSEKIILNMQKADTLYKSLVEKYGDLLNPQDWENLDLIIYFFETHRASSIFEALRRLDEVKRHDEITSLMSDVGEKICRSVSYAAANITYELNALTERQNSISRSLGEINRNIISSSEMQEALLEKSNETSQKLMEDVGRLRRIADQEALEKKYV